MKASNKQLEQIWLLVMVFACAKTHANPSAMLRASQTAQLGVMLRK